jgi:Ni,Fe-hydrogenase III small subunit
MTKMIKRIVEVYKENQVLVICGACAMNGAANVYQTYTILSK